MKKISAKKNHIVRIAALLIWCAVIFLFSANSGDESNDQSNALFEFIVRFINPAYESMDPAAQIKYHDAATFIIRKLAHFTEYAVLGALAFSAFWRISRTKPRAACASLFGLLYACTDELHQLFVSGRTGQIRDVVIDFAGAIFGTLLAVMIRRIYFNSGRKAALKVNTPPED